MSLDKAILHNKEHRKPYRKAKAVDSYCRNHGSCKGCENNRLFFDTKNRRKAELDLQEFENVRQTEIE